MLLRTQSGGHLGGDSHIHEARLLVVADDQHAEFRDVAAQGVDAVDDHPVEMAHGSLNHHNAHVPPAVLLNLKLDLADMLVLPLGQSRTLLVAHCHNYC